MTWKNLLLAGLMCVGSAVSGSAEMRGAWVASVFNINFPSKPGLSEDTLRKEIRGIVDTAKQANLNALFVQVRPEGDALYRSSLEPWSRFLSGRQGAGNGVDPLQIFIEEGAKRGIEIHAWLNPYRAAVNSSNPRHAAHISQRHPQHTKRIGNLLWMDPGAEVVRRHVVEVARDILRRYAVAGLHIDDYFYPYPKPGQTIHFPDSDTYNAYRRGGGTLSLADWRRSNVDRLVQELSQVVRSTKPGAQFGVSPFGIYTKGQPADVKAGLDQYHQLYADPVKWMRQGWVDYLAPQLYWVDGGPQSFSALLRWWRSPSVNPRGVPIYPGIAIDRLGGSHKWPVSEIARQIRAERAIGPRSQGGFILYNVKDLQQNTKGVVAAVRG